MRSLAHRWIPIVVMLAFPPAILVALRTATSLDARFFSPDLHLGFVSVISLFALMIAIAATVNARSASHPGLVHLGIGSAGVGILMLGHGLTTPGVLGQPLNPWVGRFPYLALAVFAVTLFLAGRRVDSRLSRWVGRRSTPVIAAAVAIMAAATLVVTIDPTIWPAESWEEGATSVAALAIIGLSLVVVVTHGRRWQLGKDIVQLAIAFAAAMTIAAVSSLEIGQFRQLSWWDYQAYLLAGFGCAVFALVTRASQHRRVTEALTNAFSDDPFAHIADGYPTALRQLVKAVEVKDAYTYGHSARTAHVATELGLRMGLPPDRLRVIARGAYLHDVGKIAIPDEAWQAAETCHQAPKDAELVGA